MKRAVLACAVLFAAAANAAAMERTALGTSAAVDGAGRIWVAYAQPAGQAGQVVLQRSDDNGATWQSPVRVNAIVEPVAAEGENRPKLAFGSAGEIYVTWTSPTSAQFTGDIRFARSLDGGKTWSTPTVVHRDRQLITHRFESLLVDAKGRLWVTWVDKRDLKAAEEAGRAYRGAAIYYAHSDDRGASWSGDTKLADGSCECCRIALASDSQGRVAAMWRHVFEPNERDHAFAFLGTPQAKVERATVDRWRVDACPHHGPSLAFGPDGTRHAVWFNQVDGQGRAFYGQLSAGGPSNVQKLPAGATHADLAVAGRNVAVAWKRFDGAVTRIESLISNDAGRSFAPGPSLQTAGDSDQPRLVKAGERILVVWRNSDGIAVKDLAVPPPVSKIKPFGRDTLASIEREHARSEFWLVLWDLECSYCMQSLKHMAAAQRTDPQLKIVTISTDPIQSAAEIEARLAQLGVKSDAYAFGDAPREALQYAIDATWLGEKPRAYRYAADGKRDAFSGVIQLPNRDGAAADRYSKPAGILFHTSESDLWPLEADFAQQLRRGTAALLRYLQKQQAYNYMIDRFGRVYRIVDDESRAHHAGRSVWARNDEVYLDLNSAFLGVSFESRWDGGRSLPITRAQLIAGRNLTYYLRQRFAIAPEMCVTHGLTSISPRQGLIGYHRDWARGFPFEAFGFRERFEKALRRRTLPFQVADVRLASDPLTATARGALVAALAER